MLKILLFSFLSLVRMGGFAMGQQPDNRKAASLADARSAVDLSGPSLIAAVGEPQTRLAFQSFNAEGNATEIASQLDQSLKQRGLSQLPGATFTDAYGSASYQKSGFTVTLMVMPAGKPNVVSVNVMNLGNIDLTKLPKPTGIKEVYVQPGSAMYFCDLPVEQAKQQCRELLERDGWEWFGDTTVSFFVRQGAVRMQVMCSESPAQPGKTALQYSTELMSSSLPTITDLVRISYSDSTMTLDGDSKLSTDEFVTEYRQVLESEGWKATTERPIRIDFRDHLIFSNKAKELAELIYSPFESLTRFQLKFMTAKQVENENQLAKAMAAEAKKKREAELARMKNPPKIPINKIENAVIKKASAQSIEWTVRSGTAKMVADKWLQSQKASGWKIEATIDTREIGELTLTKDNQTIRLSRIDPGFIPGEITITASPDFQLELQK